MQLTCVTTLSAANSEVSSWEPRGEHSHLGPKGPGGSGIGGSVATQEENLLFQGEHGKFLIRDSGPQTHLQSPTDSSPVFSD